MKDQKRKEIFYRWLQEHKGLLLKIIRSYARELEDQEDLLQEVSIQLWNSIPNFQGSSAESTWIYRVCLNTSIKWSRLQQRQKSRQNSIEDGTLLILKHEDQEDPRVEWLYQQIYQLDPIQKSLIILHLDGYPYKEIAEISGISESNVGVKIYRIKKLITEKAKHYEHHGI
jgi:RNA polymerase sigma-70 factor (ECF subfamily)